MLFVESTRNIHPSRPQNKRLYTPWIKDCSHTRHDRWIQTELTFTLAKNASKPDPVEIISLQTTRKENNWKTEETLARTVVTLEMERIKLVQYLMYMMIMMVMTSKGAEWRSSLRKQCSGLTQLNFWGWPIIHSWPGLSYKSDSSGQPRGRQSQVRSI